MSLGKQLPLLDKVQSSNMFPITPDSSDVCHILSQKQICYKLYQQFQAVQRLDDLINKSRRKNKYLFLRLSITNICKEIDIALKQMSKECLSTEWTDIIHHPRTILDLFDKLINILMDYRHKYPTKSSSKRWEKDIDTQTSNIQMNSIQLKKAYSVLIKNISASTYSQPIYHKTKTKTKNMYNHQRLIDGFMKQKLRYRKKNIPKSARDIDVIVDIKIFHNVIKTIQLKGKKYKGYIYLDEIRAIIENTENITPGSYHLLHNKINVTKSRKPRKILHGDEIITVYKCICSESSNLNESKTIT